MTILFEKKNTKKKKLTRVKLQAFKSIIAIFRPNFICALVIFNVHVHRSAFVHLYAYFKTAKSEEKKIKFYFWTPIIKKSLSHTPKSFTCVLNLMNNLDTKCKLITSP